MLYNKLLIVVINHNINQKTIIHVQIYLSHIGKYERFNIHTNNRA